MQHPAHPAHTTRHLDRRQIGLVAAALVALIGLAAGAIGAGSNELTGSTPLLFIYGVVVYTVVGVMILWNRPGHGVGRLALAIGLAFAIAAILDTTLAALAAPGTVQSVVPSWVTIAREAAGATVGILMAAALLLGAILLLAWFPDGRATGRAGTAVQALLAIAVGLTVLVATRDAILREIGWSITADRAFEAAAVLGAACLLFAFAIAVVDLAMRYRRADPVRRAQIRWVMATAALSAVMTAVALITSFGIALDIPGLWDLWIASTMLPILAIGVAITRYRLYEIDRIISRTIGWAIVTGLLVGTFALLVVGLQAVIEPLTGGNTLAIAGSTLVVAALFAPLRSRVQRAVDRRFDRSRYDGEQLIGAFGERLRDEVDLATISADARLTVDAAVRPASVGLWLRGGSGDVA